MQIKNIGTLLMGSFLVAVSTFFLSRSRMSFSIIFSLIIGLVLIVYYVSKSFNKEFIALEEIIEKQKKHQNSLRRIFDRLTFFDMFMLWVLIITVFGITYYFSSDRLSYLSYSATDQQVDNLLDSLYFSFITATSTGFGDITPIGNFKILAISEVVFGLVLLATLTSKLVSIKEDAILTEIYEISFNERLSRLRSSLLAFRQNLNRLINRVEENSVSKREVDDLYIYLSSFETALNEVIAFFGKSDSNIFLKQVDSVNTELIFNSILQSFGKVEELLSILKLSKLQWRRDVTIGIINHCIELNDGLFSQLTASKTIQEKIIIDMNSQKRKTISLIKEHLAS